MVSLWDGVSLGCVFGMCSIMCSEPCSKLCIWRVSSRLFVILVNYTNDIGYHKKKFIQIW
jgi:hypothetical protein